MFLRLLFLFLVTNLFSPNLLLSQGSAGSEAKHELRTLINLPTSGVLKGGYLGVDFNILPLGTLLTKIEMSPFNNFSLGVSYGLANLIGIGGITENKIPGFHAKLRLFTETRRFPSTTIGFNSQGNGQFIDSLNRYEIKSPGIYIASSKTFKFLGYIALHCQLNYSLEKDDGDENFNFGIGIEKTIGPSISILAEYDLGINDNSSTALGDGKGYLNIGVRWASSSGLTLGVNFNNLLDNKTPTHIQDSERSIYIEYLTQLY